MKSLAYFLGLIVVGLSFGVSCENAALDDLLRGRPCTADGRCADGFECDPASNLCVPFGSITTTPEGTGGDPSDDDDSCRGPADCPAPANACTRAICLGNECGLSAEPVGSESALQVAGDCREVLCDGNGGESERIDPDDTPDDGLECTTDQCESGEVTHLPLDRGTVCGPDGDGRCDGAGACAQCLVASDCTMLPPDDECQTRTCTDGVCGQDFVTAGTPLAAQSSGDCRTLVCDGNGGIASNADGSDLPDDLNPCTVDSCDGGTPTHANAELGVACGGSRTCNGSGTCVGCIVDGDCGTSNSCVTFRCEAGGNCSVTPTPDGTPLPAGEQVAGDCQILRCNGGGGVRTAAAPTDIPPDDGNPCTDEVCAAGSPQFPPLAVNTACNANGGSFCDGIGACVECNGPAQCPNQGTVCETATCLGNACGTEAIPAGTAAPNAVQVAGDCRVLECDGSGGLTSVPQANDLPDDNNDCTLDECVGGAPSHPDAPSGTVCGANGQCDGDGTCVNANKPLGATCASSQECISLQCVDDVCCDTACSGTCEVCAGPFSTGADGVCSPVSAGEDPAEECSVSETCNGAGICDFSCGQAPSPPASSTCPPACTGGCSGGRCIVDCGDGATTCENSTITCPSGFACEVRCGTGQSCGTTTIQCPARYPCITTCQGDCTNVQLDCGTGTCEMQCGATAQCGGSVVNCGDNSCSAQCSSPAAPAPTLNCQSSCSCSGCPAPT